MSSRESSVLPAHHSWHAGLAFPRGWHVVGHAAEAVAGRFWAALDRFARDKGKDREGQCREGADM